MGLFFLNMTNTKAFFILFKAFFFTQCKPCKKHETIRNIILGIALALIASIENYWVFYLIVFILMDRSINFFLLRRDLKNPN